MAVYPHATARLIPPGPNDPPIKARVAILHTDAGNAASLYGWFNGPSGGVESHFHVRKDGHVEQYRDTRFQADANCDANNFAVSIETQGYGNEPWTPQQLTAIKALLSWLHSAHNIPLQVCPSWDGSGVGYHTQYPNRWDKRGATCPGPQRIKQYREVLVPWMKAGNHDVSAPEPSKTPKPASPSIMRQGSSGEPVKRLQAGLNARFPSYSHLSVDGAYGPATAAVVAEFQRRVHLTPDGIVGPLTRTALKRYGITL